MGKRRKTGKEEEKDNDNEKGRVQRNKGKGKKKRRPREKNKRKRRGVGEIERVGAGKISREKERCVGERGRRRKRC